MSDFWKENPDYQEYKAARWRGDRQHAMRLADLGLTSPDPVERAHWLIAKASLCSEYDAVPGSMDSAWNLLNQALEAVPDHYLLRCGAFKIALAFISFEGSRSGFAETLERVQPDLRRLLREPGICYNIGAMRHSAGKWRQAKLWLDRAFAAGYLSTTEAAGQAIALSVLASVNVRLGRLDEAEALSQDAYRRHHPTGQFRRAPSMARAQIELARGRPQVARALMQEFLAESPFSGHPLNVVRLSMLAAEIALAEGNREGYRHYCERALTTCQEHGLTISIHYIQTVMAEAERRHFS